LFSSRDLRARYGDIQTGIVRGSAGIISVPRSTVGLIYSTEPE